MPENEFSSRNNGRSEDAAQNHKHLDELTTDELTDALSDIWDAMDESNYDPTQMDAYLVELEKREPISPDFHVDASLAAFQEKHARLFEQTLPVQLSTAKKPVHRRWRISLVAAIVAVVVMFCSMVTAQALGFDIFGAIARWTEDTFNFSIAPQTPNNQDNAPAPTTDGDFATLQEALDSYGISDAIAPKRLPDGFRVDAITVSPQAGVVRIRASYRAEEKALSIVVRQYDSPEGMSTSVFEKDSSGVVLYEKGGNLHYIMSNNAQVTATWIAGDRTICSIAGDITANEIESIIDSIYGDENE